MTVQLDFNRKRGDTREFEIEVTSNGAAFPVGGYSFLLTVTTVPQPVDDTSKLFQITGVIQDDLGGIVRFTPSEAQADNVGDYFYDIQMAAGAWKLTIAEGAWSLTQDRTKD